MAVPFLIFTVCGTFSNEGSSAVKKKVLESQLKHYILLVSWYYIICTSPVQPLTSHVAKKQYRKCMGYVPFSPH